MNSIIHQFRAGRFDFSRLNPAVQRWARRGRSWRSLQGLSASDRRLLLRATLVVGVMRIALWTIPIGRLRVWIDRAGQTPRLRESPLISAQRIARMVRNGARLIPRASCLTQALAAQWLLQSLGVPSHLRIGVKPAAAGQPFAAHAWLECQGQVILGGEAMDKFIPLAAASAA